MVVGWWLATEGRLEHNTPCFRIVWSPGEEPPSEVKVGGDLTTEIAFGDVGLPASEFSKIADAVRNVTEAFMADFPETKRTALPLAAHRVVHPSS